MNSIKNINIKNLILAILLCYLLGLILTFNPLFFLGVEEKDGIDSWANMMFRIFGLLLIGSTYNILNFKTENK